MFSVHYKMQVNMREGIILLTLVSGFICIRYNLISNILILNVKRFSFHVDVANKQGSICFYYQREHIAWNTVHSSATNWFGCHQVELR